MASHSIRFISRRHSLRNHSLRFISRRHSLPNHSLRHSLRQSFTRQSLPLYGDFQALVVTSCVRGGQRVCSTGRAVCSTGSVAPSETRSAYYLSDDTPCQVVPQQRSTYPAAPHTPWYPNTTPAPCCSGKRRIQLVCDQPPRAPGSQPRSRSSPPSPPFPRGPLV